MKIGLIAMSGIRVCDEELLQMGLTLPGFVERSKVIASLPSLGLLTLAGMVPPQHDVHYIEIADIRDSKSTQDTLGDFDLIAISSFSAQIKEAYQLADIIRDKGVPVVMGGLHVTCLPNEAKKYCDSVIIGEGELYWPALIKHVENGRIKPFYGNINEEFDLNDAPMPAFELLDINKYNRLTVQTCRGCSHRCEFCANSILLTKKYKQKPAEKVLAEIDKIREIMEHPFIEFADDNTFVNKEYWKKLLPEIKKRKIRWFTETDISISQDKALLKLMREGGCAQVLIGLESPSKSTLNGLETRQNWKAKHLHIYKEAIKTIQSYGISVNGCFILGLDNHDSQIFDEVYNFVNDSGLHEVQITIQTAFPGTPLYKRLKQQDRIIEESAWEKCTLFDINYNPSKMSTDDLSRGFKELGARLYSDEFTNIRRKKFKDLLRETIKLKNLVSSNQLNRLII
jgi:radical SAM superfamily enzyme YgiQ (UPF0313 family)